MDRVDYEKVVVQELLNFEKNGELDISPWYQRRSVWTTPQKAYLMNSLFEHKPVPTIYIRHSLDMDKGKSIREVVDGQQRIRSILEYVGGDFTARHPSHKKRVKYGELTTTERGQFLMTSMSIGYLIEADDSDVIDIFGRLNSVAKTLNPQEKRSARYSGEVKQFCLSMAAHHVQLWRQLEVFTANDIARMQEVQFVADLAINMLDGLSDYSSQKIDSFYKKHDESFPQQDTLGKRMETVFTKIAGANPRAIKDTIFHRTPLFFTLFIVLDSVGAKIDTKRLEETLHKVDASFNSDTPINERGKEEAAFHMACTASTQRIKSRLVRDKYLRAALGLK